MPKIGQRVKITDGSSYHGHVGKIAEIDDDCIYVEVGALWWWPCYSGEYEPTILKLTLRPKRRRKLGENVRA